MRFGGGGDLHLSGVPPQNRKDKDYLKMILFKFEFILKYCADNLITHFFVAGDFCNHPKMSDLVKALFAELLYKYKDKVEVHVVPGQHDLYFHNIKNENIPLTLFHKAGLIKYHKKSKRIKLEKDVYLYTCPWEEEIPKSKSKNEISILLIHTMIIENKLWTAQEEYIHAKTLLRHFNYVVSGDNHTTIIYKHKGNILFNSGSLVRRKTDQKNHKPCFMIFDTDNKTTEQIFVPIEPINDVMDFSKKERTSEIELILNPFVESLSENKLEFGLNYEKNVKKGLPTLNSKTKKTVIKIMNSCKQNL